MQEVVDAKSLTENDPDFQAYPGHYTQDFDKQIYQKQEFYILVYV